MFQSLLPVRPNMFLEGRLAPPKIEQRLIPDFLLPYGVICLLRFTVTEFARWSDQLVNTLNSGPGGRGVSDFLLSQVGGLSA